MRLLPKPWGIGLRALGAYLGGDQARFETHARRLLWLRLLTGHSRIVEVTFQRGDTVWTVPIHNDAVAKNLFVQGGHREPELIALLAWLERHGYLVDHRNTVVDVGANLGTPSIPICRATGKRVLAVEPIPRTYAYLERNVLANQLGNRIVCTNAAISEATGQITMICHDSLSGCEVETPTRAQLFEREARIHIPCITLEELIQKYGVAPGEVAFVCSDTQGHERQVIASGRSLWSSGAALCVELWPGGLRAHGGVETFIETASESFAGMLLVDDLLEAGADARPRPISDLAEVLSALGDRFTDALLVPDSRPVRRDAPDDHDDH